MEWGRGEPESDTSERPDSLRSNAKEGRLDCERDLLRLLWPRRPESMYRSWGSLALIFRRDSELEPASACGERFVRDSDIDERESETGRDWKRSRPCAIRGAAAAFAMECLRSSSSLSTSVFLSILLGVESLARRLLPEEPIVLFASGGISFFQSFQLSSLAESL